MKSKKNFLMLSFIFIFALSLRLVGLNWDQSQHLHPDERFLTSVISDIKLPSNLFAYFNTRDSSFNPNNNGYNFYAYGTLPLLIVKLLAHFFSLDSYDQLFLLGRVLSATLDAGVILILYFLNKNLKIKNQTNLLICFFYSLAVLPIQLSHFFTVDTFVVFFSTLTVLFFVIFLKDHRLKYLYLTAFFFGITLSCKVSLIITLPLFLFFLFLKSTKIKRIIYPFIFFTIGVLSFRIFQPYAFDGIFKFNPTFVSAIKIAHQMITGEYQYPPNIQWYSTLPVIHPLINLFLFGLGPITAILIIIGLKKSINYHFILLFIIFIFTYHALQLAKYMRYFYPIYPFLIIFAGIGFQSVSRKFFKIAFLILIILNTCFFLSLYSQTHSRVQASQWICQNIPSKSSLTYEYWDDPLPLNLNQACNNQNYNLIQLNVSDSDNSAKWVNIAQELQQSDYLILSSNRFWRSISQDPSDFPITSQFYKKIFSQQSGFKLEKTFYKYPGISLPFMKNCLLIGPNTYPDNQNSFFEIDYSCFYPGIYFRDNFAEESFTVYDHPQVIIFSKN